LPRLFLAIARELSRELAAMVEILLAHYFWMAIGVITQDSWWNGVQIFVTLALAFASYWLMGTLGQKSN
jgi:hypothetical protein